MVTNVSERGIRDMGNLDDVLYYKDLRIKQLEEELAEARETIHKVTTGNVQEKNEERFRQLVKGLPAGVYSCDSQGYITFYNDNAVKLWGRTPVIGKDLWSGSWKIFNSEGSEIPLESCPMAIALKEGHSIAGEEIIIETADGSRSHVLAYPQPEFSLSGELTGAINVLIDITQVKNAELSLRQNEARFRLMIDLMPDKITTASADGSLTYYNKNWLDYTGLSMEELNAWGWEKIIHPDDLIATAKRWLKSVHEGRNIEIEHRLLNKSGEYKWHLVRGIAVKDENRKVKMWIYTATEIQKLKDEEQRKGNFLRMVSHELKTPVASIKGYVQLLLTMLDEAPQTQLLPLPLKSYLLRIDKQIVRLTRLINDILDLSRIKEDKLILRKELFSLNDLLDETIQDIYFIAPDHIIDQYHDLKCTIYGDKDRIGQVIINLITNAIKYSLNDNKIDIRIYEPAKDQVAVSVKDYGIGIDKKDHQKIFGRFYRASHKNDQTYPGFGIGLFLSRELIIRHNGFITVESEIGQGAVFTFTLPLATGNKL